MDCAYEEYCSAFWSDPVVHALDSGQDEVRAGGLFTVADGQPAYFLAGWIDDHTTATLLSSFDAKPDLAGVALSWRFADESQMIRSWIERAPLAAGPWLPISGEVRSATGAHEMLDRTAEVGHVYFYRVVAEWADGPRTVFGPVSATSGALARGVAFATLAPNPTTGRTRMSFTVDVRSHVRLRVLDLQGRVIATLLDDMRRPGRYEASWDGHAFGTMARPGVYLVQLEAAGAKAARVLRRIGYG
jgi:hypothetical protein